MKTFTKIEMFGTKNCHWCLKAKEFFELNDIPYTYKGLEELNSDELFELLNVKAPGFKTVPIIFIDENLIGGFSDCKEYLRDGK